jgi:hypothetical protein
MCLYMRWLNISCYHCFLTFINVFLHTWIFWRKFHGCTYRVDILLLILNCLPDPHILHAACYGRCATPDLAGRRCGCGPTADYVAASYGCGPTIDCAEWRLKLRQYFWPLRSLSRVAQGPQTYSKFIFSTQIFYLLFYCFNVASCLQTLKAVSLDCEHPVFKTSSPLPSWNVVHGTWHAQCTL